MALVPPKKLEIARDRGIQVHQAIEDWHRFGMFDEEVADYLDQFILMLIENDLKVIECEKMLTDGEYAGTLDLIVQNAKNDLFIIDTKTTYVIANYVSVQLGAYYLLAQNNGIYVKGCYILHLKPDSYNLTFRQPDTEKWRELYAEYTNSKNEHNKIGRAHV